MVTGNVQELLDRSQWVINATIEKVGATTVRALPASDRTAVVRVDHILYGPKQFGDHLGRQITVYLSDPLTVKPGQKAVFFTQSWLYGESIAVVEVARFDAADWGAMQSEIDAARQNIADARLIDRLTRAELVIVGKVRNTRAAGDKQRRRIETEHAPDWWEADIGVESVLKGSLPAMSVEILFANSTDEMWIDSPKFKIGQEGIWILQRDQQEKGWPVLRVPGLTALNPLDFQPKDQVARIRKLLGRTPK